MSNVSRTVTLVTTKSQAHKDFPSKVNYGGLGLIISPYTITIPEKSNRFAAWLLEHISTTNHSDGASRVKIVLPQTDAQCAVRELASLADRIAYTSDEDALQALEAGIVKLRQRWKFSRAMRSPTWLDTIEFQWPVYGARAAEQFNTPESFWLHCAGLIRATNGVPVSVGLSGAVPPESLLRTFSKGGGLHLYERYQRELEERTDRISNE